MPSNVLRATAKDEYPQELRPWRRHGASRLNRVILPKSFLPQFIGHCIANFSVVAFANEEMMRLAGTEDAGYLRGSRDPNPNNGAADQHEREVVQLHLDLGRALANPNSVVEQAGLNWERSILMMNVVTHPAPANFLPHFVEFFKMAFPNVKISALGLDLKDDAGNRYVLYLQPIMQESATQLVRAPSNHVGNRAVNGAADLYMPWVQAIVGGFVQLGGLHRDDFAPTQLVQTSFYIAVATAGLLLTLPVLIWPNALPPAVLKFMIIVAFCCLFVNYWIIKPKLLCK